MCYSILALRCTAIFIFFTLCSSERLGETIRYSVRKYSAETTLKVFTLNSKFTIHICLNRNILYLCLAPRIIDWRI
uniref:Putative secreted protein n=1 Tax=Ixodes ricinus TaxID=34613 RepID=A0A6B0U2E9_IXORI